MFGWVWRVVLLGGFAGLVGGHSPSWPAPQTAASCNDPCATLTCPEGTRCSADSGCHAQCSPEYPPPGFKP